MAGVPWSTLAVVLAGVALNAVVAFAVVRRFDDVGVDDEGSQPNRDGATDHADGVVACPECGTENELGYRFCRQCVGELPGSRGFTGGGSSFPSGMIR